MEKIIFLLSTKKGARLVLAPMKVEDFTKSTLEQEQSYFSARCFLNEFEANGVAFVLLAN